MTAERHGVAAKVIATVDDLDRIAADDEADIPALKGWRRELFGEKALALKSRASGARGRQRPRGDSRKELALDQWITADKARELAEPASQAITGELAVGAGKLEYQFAAFDLHRRFRRDARPLCPAVRIYATRIAAPSDARHDPASAWWRAPANAVKDPLRSNRHDGSRPTMPDMRDPGDQWRQRRRAR